MGSSSGISSNSSGLQNSGSEEDLQLLMDERKRKRMISNRESARRSRLRKQKLLDELTGQVAHLRKENSKIITAVHLTTQQYLAVESENAILKAQLGELTQRLTSLDEIVAYLTTTGFDEIGGSWGCFSQPVMMAASADVGFMY